MFVLFVKIFKECSSIVTAIRMFNWFACRQVFNATVGLNNSGTWKSSSVIISTLTQIEVIDLLNGKKLVGFS